MAIVATNDLRLSNVLKGEYTDIPGYCRKTVTVNEATAKTYKPGTVLGKVTANGKYKICVQGAGDGSGTFAGMVVSDVLGDAGDISIAATTDTKIVILVRGPARVAAEGLILDASHDLLAEKQAIYDAMEAVGIAVDTQV